MHRAPICQGNWKMSGNLFGQGKCKITWKVREKYGFTHHWVENVPVIERTFDILPNFKHHMKYMDEKKVKNRSTASFGMVKFACQDNLCCVAIIACFQY